MSVKKITTHKQKHRKHKLRITTQKLRKPTHKQKKPTHKLKHRTHKLCKATHKQKKATHKQNIPFQSKKHLLKTPKNQRKWELFQHISKNKQRISKNILVSQKKSRPNSERLSSCIQTNLFFLHYFLCCWFCFCSRFLSSRSSLFIFNCSLSSSQTSYRHAER